MDLYEIIKEKIGLRPIEGHKLEVIYESSHLYDRNYVVNACRIRQLDIHHQVTYIDLSADKTRETTKEDPSYQSDPTTAFLGLALLIISYC